MKYDNLLYKDQGIHLISSIFTVDKGDIKVLLVRNNDEEWCLVGGSLYNDEDIEDGMLREIKEKTNIDNVSLFLVNVFGKKNRSFPNRMVAISYVGVVDNRKIEFIANRYLNSEVKWFSITDVFQLSYDHSEILEDAKKCFKSMITDIGILKKIYPDGFTIPEIQKVYELIYEKEYDRRNFRKRMINSDMIYDTGMVKRFMGKRPGKLYKFKENFDELDITNYS